MFVDYEQAQDWAEKRLTSLLKSMEDYELIDLMIEAGTYPEIIRMDALDEYFDDMTPSELLESLAPGFSISDEWFYENRDGFYQSFSRLADVPELVINRSDLVDEILSSMDSFGNEEIQEILDRMNE